MSRNAIHPNVYPDQCEVEFTVRLPFRHNEPVSKTFSICGEVAQALGRLPRLRDLPVEFNPIADQAKAKAFEQAIERRKCIQIMADVFARVMLEVVEEQDFPMTTRQLVSLAESLRSQSPLA